MKKKINYLNSLLFLIIIPLAFTMSCSEKPSKEEISLPPSITSLSPQTGTADTEVTITGENFGKNSNDVKVDFGSKSAVITVFTNQKMKVKAPSGPANVEVNVTVSVGNLTSNKTAFFYANTVLPSITSMTSTCFYNSIVVITGKDFSPNKEDNIVKFGTISATVIAATSTSLSVKTPDLGSASTASVTVTNSGITSNAQSIAVDVDRDKIVKYTWTTQTVKPGVTYKTGELSLFGGVQRRIYVLEVTLNESNTLGIGFSTTNAATTVMCNNYNAVAGINAGYFPISGASDKDPYIRINGVEIQIGHLGVSATFTNAALIIHNNVATVRKFTENHTNLNQVAAAIPVAQAENIIVCGPILITSDSIESQNMSSSHNTSQAARTGLGVSADGKHIFLVVVDSGGGFTGVTTPQLAKILQSLGAVNAMNFDGGGSSTMFVKDLGAHGRVNFPNGGTTQRAVRSVIYVK